MSDRNSTQDYMLQIAEGKIGGHALWSKIGFHAAITSTEIDLMPWAAGPYVIPSGALTMTIVSSSDNDNPAHATPTGAWTVTVYYLTTGFVEKTATVTLVGKTPVQIATDIYRVNNARIATCGTTGWAIGNLTIASGGTTYGYISATKTRMRQLFYTVPIAKTLYIADIGFSCSGQSSGKFCRFTLRANYDNKSGIVLQRGLYMPYREITLNNSAYGRDVRAPIVLPATTDLKVSAVSDATCVGTSYLGGWMET